MQVVETTCSKFFKYQVASSPIFTDFVELDETKEFSQLDETKEFSQLDETKEFSQLDEKPRCQLTSSLLLHFCLCIVKT